jgi:ankyrin repeat protein
MSQWDPLLVDLVRAAIEDPAQARLLVKSHPQVLDLRTGLGETALHYLAIEDYADAVQLLIDMGAKVNVVNEFGKSALAEAKLAGAERAVKVLIGAGAAAEQDAAADRGNGE